MSSQFKISSKRRNSSASLPESRYVQGGVVEIYPNRLGFWEKRELPRHITDILTNIQAKEHRRPDLVSYRIYGKSIYQWLVLQYNNIVDLDEFTQGTTLQLPQPRRLLLDIMTKPPGGKRM